MRPPRPESKNPIFINLYQHDWSTKRHGAYYAVSDVVSPPTYGIKLGELTDVNCHFTRIRPSSSGSSGITMETIREVTTYCMTIFVFVVVKDFTPFKRYTADFNPRVHTTPLFLKS